MTALREIPLEDVLKFSESDAPTPKIKLDEDVEHWKTTQSYKDYSVFLGRLSDSVVNYQLPWSPPESSPAILKMVSLLETLDRWIDEIPPLKTPQRFGNLAFRTWGQRLDENSNILLEELLGPEYSPVIKFVRPYLMTSFGSFTRMDYGTGHETSFVLFLLCLTLVRFFDPVPEVERQLVLVVFLRYLRLCWKLQDTYRLEPAGSHGVWGLDDSHFLPYVFGSAQLRDQSAIPVSMVLQKPLPDTNMYFLSISRIHEVKHGPFHEHSSSLHSIAVGVPNWGKVHSGLLKMYEAEVLGKRVVVQHIPLGGLLQWEANDEARSRLSSPAPFPTQAPASWSPALPTPTPSRLNRRNTPLMSSMPPPTTTLPTHRPLDRTSRPT
ncbi:serine/threonine-protein phosphatase 2A activator 1 [Coprinopsis marcescibilis]|uniref:Serine/threonine-protein phosphatase 2A activator n=1 Tax=Coprinopsis marcescibilis TaxID=230819 RepID=A0A5C3KWJ2_COPMA|nr:serine/threonine-protein phosphatase 2A activator 1 [Coprinopsis marcescibilis]